MTSDLELLAVLCVSLAGLYVHRRFERAQTPEAWAAGTALISCVVLVLNYLRERGPAKTVDERLDAAESDISKLKTWNRYE